MIEYRKYFENNIVEISVKGLVTEADFDQVIPQLEADIKKHHKLRVLEEVLSFDGMEPMALWKDLQFGLIHINDFTHAAVVTDAWWIRGLSQAVDNVLPIQVKAFEASELEAARHWLATA
jgi:hypothetical protein